MTGLGYLSLVICGRSFDWEAAFDPIHKKLGLGRHSALNLESPTEEKESLIESGGTVELTGQSQGKILHQ